MGNICVIGPRATGKTTYLAALAYWHDTKKQLFKVTGITEDAKKLKNQAQNIILNGDSLPPNEIDGVKIKTVYDLPLYSFKIEIKRRFKAEEQIDLVVRDYPGEIFNELASGISNSIHQDFLDECLVKDVVGGLMLFDNWERGNDGFYCQVIERFIELMSLVERTQNFRLAIAISKCERGEIWPGRLDPKIDIFDVHFPRTTSILQQKIPASNLQFYALSTFGVMERNDPRPNRTDELGSLRCILRNPHEWRPYNLISPLYWLSKGKRMSAGV